MPERSWGTACRTPQEEPQFSALFKAIHVVGKFHTDSTRSTEGPTHQSERLACPGEVVSLKVDKATFWAKERNGQDEKPPHGKTNVDFFSNTLFSKWGFDANTQTLHIVAFCFVCSFWTFLTEYGRIRKKEKIKPATQIPLLAAPVNILNENNIVDFEALSSVK